MTVTFITNFVNHHQIPLADELYHRLGEKYHYIEICNTIDLVDSMSGYSLIDRPYIVRPLRGRKDEDLSMNLVINSDVLIWGSYEALHYVKMRYKNRKDGLVFEFGERWLKRGLSNLFSPRLIANKCIYYFFAPKNNAYRLCASAYAAQDEKLLLSYKHRCLKWAYFTNVPIYDVSRSITDRQLQKKIRILWIGRFLKWKHPEKMIYLGKALKKASKEIEIIMIGEGPLYMKINSLIKSEHLGSIISLYGTRENSEILNIMRSCHILCTTSDRKEGWGAVLNEGMASACCPVASVMAGSTPYLVESGKNGFIYKEDKELINAVIFLIDHPAVREMMMFNAYETMYKIWNPKLAADRLVEFCNKKLNGEDILYDKGPLSFE